MKPAAVITDMAFMTNGILEPVPGYVAGVFERVRKAGGLCISDEVQSGFGRMGEHFFGYMHHGVVPDFVTIGKPAGNGHPIGVVLTRPEIFDHFPRADRLLLDLRRKQRVLRGRSCGARRNPRPRPSAQPPPPQARISRPD
jgi:4-aminobutyrate aminotransferase-like enzyme